MGGEIAEGPATVLAAWIGGGFLLVVAIVGWVISIRTNRQQSHELQQIKAVEIQSAEGLQLRGLLEEQARATDVLRSDLADCRAELDECNARHIDDERRIFVLERSAVEQADLLRRKDFEVDALRFQIQQLRTGE